MTEAEYRAQFSEDEAVGWNAIDVAIDALYPNQEPRHYGTLLKFMTGGE